jgi:hypothetical protein
MPYFAPSDSRLQLPLDRQRAALTEAELRQHARSLIMTLSDYWFGGILAAVDLRNGLSGACTTISRRMTDTSSNVCICRPPRIAVSWFSASRTSGTDLN